VPPRFFATLQYQAMQTSQVDCKNVIYCTRQWTSILFL